MQKIKSIFKILLITVLAFTINIVKVEAADDEEGIGFTVRPNLPTTQLDLSKGFYYFETKPGEKQEIELSVHNTRKSDIELEFVIEDAITQTNGEIGYSSKIEDLHESLINPVTEIFKPQKETTIIKADGKEHIVYFDVTPPKESYDGIKMGRILVKEKQEESKGVSQVFQYQLGIIMSESGDMFNDGTELLLNDVKPAVSLGFKVVQGELVNPLPKTMEGMTVRSYIAKKGENKKLKERNIDNFSFAPNSKTQFEINWGLGNFEAGEYVFHFLAENNTEKFSFAKPFKVSGEEAKNLNKQAAFAVNTPQRIKIIIIVLNSLLVLISIVIIVRNKKWVNDLKSKQKKRKSKGRKKR